MSTDFDYFSVQIVRWLFFIISSGGENVTKTKTDITMAL
jgi:hypothetical protein